MRRRITLKAWIDYQCFALRENIGPLDANGCAQNVDVDKAMSVLAHNELLGLRWHLDGETPKGYKRYKQSSPIYLDTEDLQRLRNIENALSTTSGQSLLDRLQKLEAERSEMWRWFERHHVTGDLSLEEKDAMTPKQMADYVYEELQRLLDETRAMLRTNYGLR